MMTVKSTLMLFLGYLLLVKYLLTTMRMITKTGHQIRRQSMIPKISLTCLLLLIPRLQWTILLDIEMMMVKKLLVQMLHHPVTSRPHQMMLRMVQFQHH
jgi:hypothetical protein